MVISESFKTKLYWRVFEEKPISWAEVLEQEHLSLAMSPETLQDVILARDSFERDRSETLIRILNAGVAFIKISLGTEASVVLNAAQSALFKAFLDLVQNAGDAYRTLAQTPESSALEAWRATDQVLRRGPALENELRAQCKYAEEIEALCQALRRFLADLEAGFCSDEAWMPLLLQQLSKSNRTALCLSGGGIRSASFSLGVIQALSRLGLLKRFDYLSTVSGGGFTGGWLSAWIHHEQGDVARVEKELANHEPKWAGDPKRYAHGPEPASEAPPLWRLRINSNYLAPRLGMLSVDIWTLVALVLRNCLVHWMVLVPLVLALLTVPRLFQAAMGLSPSNGTALGFGVTCFFAAFVWAFQWRPQKRPEDPRSSNTRATMLIGFMLLSGVLLAWQWGSASSTADTDWRSLFRFALLLGLLATIATLLWSWSELRIRSRKGWTLLALVTGFSAILAPLLRFYFGSPVGILLGVILGVLLGLATVSLLDRDTRYLAFLVFPLGMMAGMIFRWIWSHGSHWVKTGHGAFFTLVGLPLVLLLAFLCTNLAVVIGSRKQIGEGTLIDNADREWFARLGAWSLISSVAWLILSSISLYGPLLVIHAPALYSLFTSGTLGVALVGILSSRGRGQKDKDSGSPWSVLGNHIAPVGSLAGALLILVGLSVSLDWLLTTPITFPASNPAPSAAKVSFLATNTGNNLSFQISGEVPTRKSGYDQFRERLKLQHEAAMPKDQDAAQAQNPVEKIPWRGAFPLIQLLLILLAGTILSLLIGCLFPLQEFSLHALYRNRLIRAYLGSTRKDRQPDPFTGFAPADDFPMADLSKDSLPQRPFHVINVALNQVYGEKLAWQERKASSFTISPLHCGTFFQLGYRSSKQYAKSITLGTAMTISGAAANPNMGYHSSPILAFTMTFFAVRLGAWLGNPGSSGQKTFSRLGPTLALKPILGDALGLASTRHSYVSLSDGGHFENLGLYEMVARRCRLIVVCDAGADPEFKYEDLGNAIRKIRIDHGISIQLHQELPRKCTLESLDPKDTPRVVMGTIEYSAVDGGSPKLDGLLVYIKTHLWDAVPADILTYALNHDAFPHEGTSDQFFSESQFESYRALGESIILRATPEAFDTQHAGLLEWAMQLRIAQQP